jgi:hypothetical protein
VRRAQAEAGAPVPALLTLLALALALGLWATARLELYNAWDQPLLSPGLGPLLLLLAAGTWALAEPPRLAPGGGRTVLAWLAGGTLLALGQAVLYYRVVAKDREAGLGMAALAGGALLLWPERAGRRAALLGMALLAAAALWMMKDPSVTWDLYDGPWAGQVPVLIFWAGMAACVGGLAYGASRARPAPTVGPPLGRGAEWALLALALACAAALRFAWPAQLPHGYWFDEVSFSESLRDKIMVQGLAPLYDGIQAGAFDLACAAVVRLFGPGVATLRLTSAAFGLAALLPFWGLSRIWLGRRWALAATFCFGVMRWPAMLERIAFPDAFAVFWTLAAFWGLWSAQARPTEPGRRPWRWALAGLLAGATLHTYTAARAVPLICLAFLLLQHWLDPAWERSPREWLALAGGYVVTAGPMLWYMVAHTGEYQARAAQVSLFADVARSGQPLAAALGGNLARSLLMFTYRGDANARHDLQYYPQADFMLALALALALPWALGRARRDARGRFLWLWLAGALAAGVLSLPIEAPQAHRCVLAAPALALAAAWALQELSAPLGRAFTGGWPRVVGLMGLALLLGSALINAEELLVEWPADQATWEDFSPRASAVLRRIQAAGPGVSVFVSTLPHEYQFYGNEWGLFGRYALSDQGRYCSPLQATQSAPIQDRGRPLQGALLIWGESDADISAAFHGEFPGLAVERAPAPFAVAGMPDQLYLAAEVPLALVPRRPARGPLPLLYRTY